MVPETIIQTALISVCDKGRQPERALELFEAMKQQGVGPDAIAMDALVLTCATSHQWLSALALFAESLARELDLAKDSHGRLLM